MNHARPKTQREVDNNNFDNKYLKIETEIKKK